MNVDPKTTLGGVRIVPLRDFFRSIGPHKWTTSDLGGALDLDREGVSGLVAELRQEGYIEGVGDEPDAWRSTDRGRRLGDARARKPVLRGTADRHLEEFLVRVTEVDRNRELAYRVRRVLLFGSYLTGSSDRLGDVDLAVELAPREREEAKQAALARSRIESAQRSGRTFRTFIHELAWPQDEVFRFLRSRSRVISLHSVDEVEEHNWPTKVLFEER